MVRREVTVLAAERSDSAVLAAIDAAGNPQPWSEQSFSDELAQDYSIVLKAETEGTIVGFVCGRALGDELYIHEIAVEPTQRRKGIGRALLHACMAEAARRGCLHTALEVRVSNHPAQQLYRALGFESAGIRRGLYTDPDEDGAVMTASLFVKE